MPPKIPAGFRSGSLPTPTPLPDPVDAGQAHQPEDPPPRVRPSAAPDDDQRLSHPLSARSRAVLAPTEPLGPARLAGREPDVAAAFEGAADPSLAIEPVAAQAPTLPEAAVRDLLRRYLSAPSAGPDLMARMDALAPQAPDERSYFGYAVRQAIGAGMLAGIAIDANNRGRFDELALCLARFNMVPRIYDAPDRGPWCLDNLSEYLELLHGPRLHGPEAALDLATAFLAEGANFRDWVLANWPDDLRHRLLAAMGLSLADGLWRHSVSLSVAQFGVIARAVTLDPDPRRDRWLELTNVTLLDRPWRIPVMAGCLAAAQTGRDPVMQALETLGLSPGTRTLLQTIEEDLSASIRYMMARPDPIAKDIATTDALAWLGAHMLDDPLCVFDPASALDADAAKCLPAIDSAQACALLEDFYQIGGLFDGSPPKTHLRRILSDARLDDAMRLEVARALLRTQPLSRGHEQLAQWMAASLAELQTLVQGEAPGPRALAHAVEGMADTWDRVLKMAVAVEDRGCAPLRSITDAVDQVLAQWREADGLLVRWDDVPPRDGPSPTMLLRRRMEEAIGDAYLSIPDACGLGSDHAAPSRATLDELLLAVRAQQGFWTKADAARAAQRLDDKATSGLRLTMIPLWALRQVEAQILHAQATAKLEAARPRGTDGKPAPGSRTPQPLQPPGQS